MPKTWRLLGWQCGHFQIADPPMNVSLISNNSDSFKVHFMVVFVDMAGDLRVIVEHRKSPFVFCDPCFQ